MRGLLTGVALLSVAIPALVAYSAYADCSPATRAVSPDGTDVGNDCLATASPCATIGRAVAVACPGDTITVAPGTYPEQLVIGTSLTLIGSGAASTSIQAPATLPSGGNIVTIQGTGVQVEMSGFTINGPGASGCGSINAGVQVRDHATANLHDNTVSNVRDEPMSGCQNGRAIRVGENATPATATVIHNVIVGYQKNGIDLRNAGTTATITGNTITGTGLTPLIAQNGIVVVSAGATIQGNTVTGNDCNHTSCGPDPISDTQSTGVLLLFAQAGTTVTDNTMSANDIGIYNNAVGPTTIMGNAVTDNRYIGICLDEGNAAVNANVVTGSDVGVLAISFDGNDGNSGGTLTANFISGNRVGVQLVDQQAGDGFVPSLTAHANSIVGNTIGFDNEIATPQDATGNWWGCAAGPGNAGCDTVAGTVDASAPLSGPAAGAACIAATDCGLGDAEPQCTAAVCTAGLCGVAPRPNGTTCDDGNACTGPDTCLAGACGGGCLAEGSCLLPGGALGECQMSGGTCGCVPSNPTTTTSTSTTTTTLPATAKIVPERFSMVVGEQRTLQVVDMATGAFLPNVPLTSSAPDVVTIATDNPALLSAVAPGQATLTAGAATATVTVFEGPVLPTGTIRWTAPSDGSGVVKTVSAIPSDNPAAVADVFTLEASGRVQALTSDGALVWARTESASAIGLLPDMSGGVLGLEWNAITRLDPATGQTSWAYSARGVDPSTVAIHPDGTILFLGWALENPFAQLVVGIDGVTGATRFEIPLENSTYQWSGGCEAGPGYGESNVTGWRPIVTADGMTYFAYVVEHWTGGGDCLAGSQTTVRALKLLGIDANGGTTMTTLHTWTAGSGYTFNEASQSYDTTDSPLTDVGIETAIAPGDQAITLTWTAQTLGYTPSCDGEGCTPWVPPGPVQQSLTVANATGVVSESAITEEIRLHDPMIAGEEGVLFAPANVGTDEAPALAAISPGGTVLWTEAGNFEPIAATSDGGVVARQLMDPGEHLTTFSPSGVTSVDLGTKLQYSWLGDWYTMLNLETNSMAATVASVAAPPVEVGTSLWAAPAGNSSGTGAATRSRTQILRARIATLAQYYVGSLSWREDLDNIPRCNIFVRDVLREAGTAPPMETAWTREVAYLLALTRSEFYPSLAGDWANPRPLMKCWRTLPQGPDAALPGDVIAEAIQYSDATGHVGIIVGPQVTSSADSRATPPGKITLSDYGFRPDDDPRLYGQKRHAVVKRFECH
ncbi:MAG: NosD domain-containing protein [Candidatus Binatia bacterium]